MIKAGILNPHINSLVSRVRHTNLLMIADRGFPYYPGLETIDISLTDNIPTVLQVFNALRPNFVIGEIYMAGEFLSSNPPEVQSALTQATAGLSVTYEAHIKFKQRLSQVIGIIRTADVIPYANMLLVSA